MRRIFAISFILAMTIFAAFALYSYTSSKELIRDVKLRTRAFNEHERIHLLSDSLDDAETARYRYIISGKKDHLKRFEEAVGEVEDGMKYLHELEEKSDAFWARLNRLDRLVDRRLEILKRSVELFGRRPNDTGAQITLTVQGTFIGKAIDEVLGSMMREENTLFSDLEKQLTATFDHIISTMIIGTFITFAIIFMIFYRLSREMAQRIRAQKELERASRRNELILESAGEGIFGLDDQGVHTFINKAAAAMLGYRMEELVGKHSHQIWHHTRADGRPYPQEECLIYGTFREGLASHVTDEVFWKKDGASFPVEYRTSPVFEDGRIKGAVVTFSDVTWRRKAEEKLNLLVEDLKRSNSELEQFAYVASHDLKEPLLVIAMDLKLLQRQCRGMLGAEAAEFIVDALDRATRMQALISDLLLFSRIGQGKAFEPTDCGDALSRALANLKISLESSGAVVTHDELPVIAADPIQIIQLFQNLIGNAIKFGDERGSRVHISAEPVEAFRKAMTVGHEFDGHLDGMKAGWVFSIRDNGPGIPPEQADRIFEIFHRLHKDKAGTGIGLATCKKIVERHGGRIWVRSEPGKGATFYFTIPGTKAV